MPSRELADDIAFFRYRERFKLSYSEALNEPAYAIAEAFLIWEMDSKRDKLERERERRKNASP